MTLSELVMALNKGQPVNSTGSFTIEMVASSGGGRGKLRQASHNGPLGTEFGSVEFDGETITAIFVDGSAKVEQFRRVQAAIKDTGLVVR